MAFVPLVKNGKTTTLATPGGIGAADVACALTDAALGSETYKVWICFEPTSSTNAEWSRALVAGTSVTQMERTSGKVHAQNCEVRLVMAADPLNDMMLFMEDGWTPVPSHLTLAYVSASSFSIQGDWTSILSKGDKLRLTNGSTKYLYVTGTSFASGVTTVTVTGGSDYTLASGAITLLYYSKSESPAGFPSWHNWTPTVSVNGGGTTPTYTATYLSRFRIAAGECRVQAMWYNTAGGTAGSGAGELLVSSPVACSTALFVANRLAVGHSFATGTANQEGAIRFGSDVNTLLLGSITSVNQATTTRSVSFFVAYPL